MWHTEARTSISKRKLEERYAKKLEQHKDDITKAVAEGMKVHYKTKMSPTDIQKREKILRAMEERKYLDMLKKEAEIEVKSYEKMREVTLQVRYSEVTLSPKKRKEPVTVTAIHFEEKKEYKYIEKVSWVLLTTKKVSSGKEAAEQGKRYKQRWAVEEYFNTFKSVMHSEKKAYKTIEDFQRFAAITGPLSAELQRWKDKLRTASHEKVDKYMSKEMIEKVNIACEWHSLKKLKKRSKMRDLEEILGYLGGHRKGSKYKIGKKTLMRGLQEVESVWNIYKKIGKT